MRMGWSCRAASAVVLAGLAGCAGPAPAESVGPVMRRATTAGVGTRVASYAKWNERCEPAGLPQAGVTRQPAHGTLEVRQTLVIAGNRRFSGTTNCRDKEIPGIELWYAPMPGFRGTDVMTFQVDNGDGLLRFSATVDVR